MLEHPEQLVDGVRPERVEHVGPVERDPDRAVGLRAVVGQVGQVVEAGDGVPGLGVEDLRTLRRSRSWRARYRHGAAESRPTAAVLWQAWHFEGEYEPSPASGSATRSTSSRPPTASEANTLRAAPTGRSW